MRSQEGKVGTELVNKQTKVEIDRRWSLVMWKKARD